MQSKFKNRARIIKEFLKTEFALDNENLIVYSNGSEEDTDYTESDMATNRMVKVILKDFPKWQGIKSVLNWFTIHFLSTLFNTINTCIFKYKL